MTIVCPDDCPTLVEIGQPSYNTTSGLSGSEGMLWMKYTAWAESEMVQDFKCVVDEEDSESNDDD